MCRYWPLIQRAQAQLAAELSRIGLAVSVYAETHDRWPADLSEVKLSLPLDPWTGRPFRLEIRNEMAVVAAPHLGAGIFRALSTSQFKAEEWRTCTVVRRAR
jgi:hypothetical protein